MWWDRENPPPVTPDPSQLFTDRLIGIIELEDGEGLQQAIPRHLEGIVDKTSNESWINDIVKTTWPWAGPSQMAMGQKIVAGAVLDILAGRDKARGYESPDGQYIINSDYGMIILAPESANVLIEQINALIVSLGINPGTQPAGTAIENFIC